MLVRSVMEGSQEDSSAPMLTTPPAVCDILLLAVHLSSGSVFGQYGLEGSRELMEQPVKQALMGSSTSLCSFFLRILMSSST